MHLQKIIFLLSSFILLKATHLQIPLAYAYSQQLQTKYPIQLSFQYSQTFTPSPTDTLYLYNANISLQTQRTTVTDGKQPKVIIGLKYPSQFIRAVSSYFKVQQNDIQFGKQEYLKLIINDLSFIQSQDIFINHGYYDIKAQYNYGQPIQISNQQVEIFDGDEAYWNQILLRRILTNLKKENDINFKFQQSNRTVQITGQLQNFPQITIMSGTYLFRIDTNKLLKNKRLNYLSEGVYDIYSSSKQPSRIGLSLLSEFSKFQIDEHKIIFKRTSQLFMLYIFLAYFFGFCLFIIIKNRDDHFKTIQFIRSIISWVFFKDNSARVQVLRTQLQ